LITVAAAQDLRILPIRLHPNGTLDVVVGDPRDKRVPRLLEQLPVNRVRVGMAPPSQLRDLMNRTFSTFSAVEELAATAVTDAGAAFETDSAEDFEDDSAPVIQIVNRLVSQALRDRASDVHIEPIDKRVRVRFRIDGALREVISLPVNLGRPLVSRIKIMAEMNIVEQRRPQDGQFHMRVDNRDLDVRVSTTATIWGEKTVLRLLDKTRALYRLDDLGMPPEIHGLYSSLARSPFGMLVISGPTGSGKTTTLYATLAEINRSDINVMTIEDPVEYVVPEINQLQINEQADVTFANGLKSILRQDPDVILVGEMRDLETARIAVQSALTGHFVLSSLHATDTIAAMYRLLNMGVESFAVASSIVGMVAQRLVRRVCTACMEPYTPSPQELAFYERYNGPEKETFMHGTGCARCAGTGYFDRIGVYEVLPVSDEMRQGLVSGIAPAELRELAEKNGMKSLREEAVQLVSRDLTTIDEVLRTVYIAEGTS
jgi:type IV pilus assembly protein PilB